MNGVRGDVSVVKNWRNGVQGLVATIRTIASSFPNDEPLLEVPRMRRNVSVSILILRPCKR